MIRIKIDIQRIEKLWKNEWAVSPVIGITLLVGMTVILISVAAVAVLGFTLPATMPQAKIVIVEAKGGIGDMSLYKNFIVLRHKGGDALIKNDTKVIITGKGYSYSTGEDPKKTIPEYLRVTYRDLTGENDLYGDNTEIVNGISWDAGESITLYGRDGHTGDNTVDCKWKLQAGSTVLVTIIDIHTNNVIAVSQATVKKA